MGHEDHHTPDGPSGSDAETSQTITSVPDRRRPLPLGNLVGKKSSSPRYMHTLSPDSNTINEVARPNPDTTKEWELPAKIHTALALFRCPVCDATRLRTIRDKYQSQPKVRCRDCNMALCERFTRRVIRAATEFVRQAENLWMERHVNKNETAAPGTTLGGDGYIGTPLRTAVRMRNEEHQVGFNSGELQHGNMWEATEI